MSGSTDPEILNIEQAAQLLGVSVKTFNKVLHSQNLPARKIGREWKFSRRALIDWVGEGNSVDYYRENSSNGAGAGGGVVTPQPPGAAKDGSKPATDGGDKSDAGEHRRTSGWSIEKE
ncbi:MAG: helix-turn-helix domain-containing protein [Planctomycetota bacterium]|jgi:excisionase family DNA binding protein